MASARMSGLRSFESCVASASQSSPVSTREQVCCFVTNLDHRFEGVGNHVGLGSGVVHDKQA